MRTFETPLYPYERSPDQDASMPARHPVVVVGAGPAGLAAAIDLARRDIPVVLLDENDRVSYGSRAICFAKRTLEILDRLGCGDEIVDRGVTWSRGKVFFRDRCIYEFDLLAEEGHRRPAFINLQQYRLEELLVGRLRDLQSEGRPVELRGGSRVTKVEPAAASVLLTVETPEGPYRLEAEWVVACDGAGSTVRRELGLEFAGRAFEDNFLIADVTMKADFPTERWFWFDPPFNRGQSALLHKQPEGLWRIDLQLGRGVDREEEQRPENVVPRLRQMLGDDVEFELEWISVYTFQCARIDRFRHGRVLFAGDAAHQVSPFGARGANSGIQDVDNLVWKLERVLRGRSPDSLLDSYDAERVPAADENILNSTRSTDFISPKSETSRLFRDAVLNLAETQPMARPLVNSGRLSLPHVYLDSPLQSPDTDGLPARTRPGSPAVDAPLGDGWLLARLGDRFQLLALGNCAAETGCAGVPARIRREAPASGSSAALGIDVPDDEPGLEVVSQPAGRHPLLNERYLGDAPGALYLLRPDQHVAARFTDYDPERIADAFRRARARETDDP
ncbi:MAG: FAD-dependent oxidoreductase [Acidobacteriota bacterium]|nr:FAD-dependent oxidoreductase [Acidobacteriota bacterium]